MGAAQSKDPGGPATRFAHKATDGINLGKASIGEAVRSEKRSDSAGAFRRGFLSCDAPCVPIDHVG